MPQTSGTMNNVYCKVNCWLLQCYIYLLVLKKRVNHNRKYSRRTNKNGNKKQKGFNANFIFHWQLQVSSVKQTLNNWHSKQKRLFIKQNMGILTLHLQTKQH